MPKRRKTGPSGVLTTLIIVGAAALLLLVGNWLKGRPLRRAPLSAPSVSEASTPAPEQAEIQKDEREQLERLLKGGERR